jgi:hypothetical protein
MSSNNFCDCTEITIVYYCHDGQGNFVMSKQNNTCRDEHGCWDPESGGLEFGDIVENTLKVFSSCTQGA